MSRKPVVVLASSGRPYGRQAVWEMMRKLRRFTLADLCHLDMERDTVRDYLRGLVKAGYVAVVVEHGRATPAAYELARDVGLEAPRVRRDGSPVERGQARDHMWRAMKMLPSFSFVDLAVSASSETVQVSEQDAQDYVKHLLRAKYLAVLQPATNRHKAVYRLVRNTGPRPPMVTRAKVVFDPNLGCVAWCEEVDA
jgi:hypothetical protein